MVNILFSHFIIFIFYILVTWWSTVSQTAPLETYISNSLNTDTASSYSVLMKTLFSLNHEKVQGENLYQWSLKWWPSEKYVNQQVWRSSDVIKCWSWNYIETPYLFRLNLCQTVINRPTFMVSHFVCCIIYHQNQGNEMHKHQ